MDAEVSVSVACATIRGTEALPVSLELAVSAGIPGISIVGMPDGHVLESKSRVRSALKSTGFRFPRSRLTVNLSPAETRKTGTGFDLPLAVSILVATRQMPAEGVMDCLFAGELGLDGSVREVRGLVAYDALARRMGMRLVCNPSEGGFASDAMYVCRSLGDLRHGVGELPAVNAVPERASRPPDDAGLDYADVLDQDAAKRALVISATGNHGLLMVGPPGSGKSMLAKRLPTILPPLTAKETEGALLVHSVAGQDLKGVSSGLRPFRAPHHSISMAGMIGGGRPVLPGEVSLAHEGVLFLDELPEFATNVLQALRQPFEEHEVRIVRADGLYRFPCDFTFVAASNPCPCGYLGDAAHQCRCTPSKVEQYQSRIGGPLKDRIDMHVFVSRPDSRKVVDGVTGMDSNTMREQVLQGREFAQWRRNRAQPAPMGVLEGLDLDRRASVTLESMARRLGFGGRAIVRVARVARTIADIDQSEHVGEEEVLEACAYRDRRDG